MILDRRIIATSGGNGGVERRTGCVLFMRNVRTVYTQALLSLFVVIFHRILFSRVLQRLYPSWLLAGPLHGALVSADWWPQQGVYSCICLVGSRQSSLFFFLIISFFLLLLLSLRSAKGPHLFLKRGSVFLYDRRLRTLAMQMNVFNQGGCVQNILPDENEQEPKTIPMQQPSVFFFFLKNRNKKFMGESCFVKV